MKRRKQKRTNVCQWCDLGFDTATEHMIHVTEAHPETIGRGRTMSKAWSCPRLGCGHDNPPVVDECGACGAVNVELKAQNAARAFVVVRRRGDGSLWRSRRTSAFAARYTLLAQPDLYRRIYGTEVVLDKARFEVWSLDGRTRLVWLEIADVTETSNYIPPGKDST